MARVRNDESRWERPGECLRCTGPSIQDGLCQAHLATIAELGEEYQVPGEGEEVARRVARIITNVMGGRRRRCVRRR